jgi:hypothetical protein
MESRIESRRGWDVDPVSYGEARAIQVFWLVSMALALPLKLNINPISEDLDLDIDILILEYMTYCNILNTISLISNLHDFSSLSNFSSNSYLKLYYII